MISEEIAVKQYLRDKNEQLYLDYIMDVLDKYVVYLWLHSDYYKRCLLLGDMPDIVELDCIEVFHKIRLKQYSEKSYKLIYVLDNKVLALQQKEFDKLLTDILKSRGKIEFDESIKISHILKFENEDGVFETIDYKLWSYLGFRRISLKSTKVIKSLDEDGIFCIDYDLAERLLDNKSFGDIDIRCVIYINYTTDNDIRFLEQTTRFSYWYAYDLFTTYDCKRIILNTLDEFAILPYLRNKVKKNVNIILDTRHDWKYDGDINYYINLLRKQDIQVYFTDESGVIWS